MGDAIPAHLVESVQVVGQLGVTACVSTPLWQSPPNGKRRGPASSERAWHDARSDVEVRVEVGRHGAGNTRWGAKRWSHRERACDVREKEGEARGRKRKLREREE